VADLSRLSCPRDLYLFHLILAGDAVREAKVSSPHPIFAEGIAAVPDYRMALSAVDPIVVVRDPTRERLPPRTADVPINLLEFTARADAFSKTSRCSLWGAPVSFMVRRCSCRHQCGEEGTKSLINSALQGLHSGQFCCEELVSPSTLGLSSLWAHDTQEKT